jgi:hypothetical protein
MAYIAPPGIGDPGATRAAAVMLRRRADVLERTADRLRSARVTVVLQGPGGDRFRHEMDGLIPGLQREADDCRYLAAQLDGAAGAAESMLARQARERREEQIRQMLEGHR